MNVTSKLVDALAAINPRALLSRRTWRKLTGEVVQPVKVAPVPVALRRLSFQVLPGGVMQSNAVVDELPEVPAVRMVPAPDGESNTWFVPFQFVRLGEVSLPEATISRAQARMVTYEGEVVFGDVVLVLPVDWVPVAIGWVTNLSVTTLVWADDSNPQLIGANSLTLEDDYPMLAEGETGWQVLAVYG